jgi:hypothetical protein
MILTRVIDCRGVEAESGECGRAGARESHMGRATCLEQQWQWQQEQKGEERRGAAGPLLTCPLFLHAPQQKRQLAAKARELGAGRERAASKRPCNKINTGRDTAPLSDL